MKQLIAPCATSSQPSAPWIEFLRETFRVGVRPAVSRRVELAPKTPRRLLTAAAFAARPSPRWGRWPPCRRKSTGM